MIRLIAITFALTLATSVQAMPVAPLHQPDNVITQARVGHPLTPGSVAGVNRRQNRRCARWNGSVCAHWY